MLPEEIEEIRSFAEFRIKAVPDDKATEEKGELVLRDAIVLKVAHSKNQIIEIEANQTHAKKFPREWAAFRLTDEYLQFMDADKEAGNITPIEQLKALPAITQTLRSMGIRSVEAFASADDDRIGHLQGAKVLQAKAKKMLEPKKATMGNKAA